MTRDDCTHVINKQGTYKAEDFDAFRDLSDLGVRMNAWIFGVCAQTIYRAVAHCERLRPLRVLMVSGFLWLSSSYGVQRVSP